MAKKNGFRDFGHLVPHQMARWIAADGKHENQPMTEPDENPVIATLLEDAARLATAANEKLAEALAIAEQTRLDAAFNADRQWFKSRGRIELSRPPRHAAGDQGLAQPRRMAAGVGA